MKRALALLLLSSPALRAQTRADSASSARAEWREVMRAYNAREFATSRDHAVRAAAIWPTQSAYVYGAASLSARMGDTASAIRWLSRYDSLGLGAEITDDDDFDLVRSAPGFVVVANRVRANLTSVPHSRLAFALPDSSFFPEGIACAHDGTCYVSSVRHGVIARVDPAGHVSGVMGDSADGHLAILGVVLSPDGKTLWAGSAGIPQREGYATSDSGRAAVMSFDARSGRLLRRLIPPQDSLAASPGDLSVTAAGEVLVSDNRRGVIYRVPRAGDTLEVLVRSPLLCSPQGIAESADRKLLYVADYCHGILAIDRATGSVQAVSTPAGTTTLGIDGMIRVGDDLIGIQNGTRPPRVVRLRIGPDPLTIAQVETIDRNLSDADQPTSGASVGRDYLYVADSHWDFYRDDGTLRKGAALRRPMILRLPLSLP